MTGGVGVMARATVVIQVVSYHKIIRQAADRERVCGVGGRCLIVVLSNTIRSLRQVFTCVFDLTGGPGERSRPGGGSGGSELPSIIRGIWERELSARVAGWGGKAHQFPRSTQKPTSV